MMHPFDDEDDIADADADADAIVTRYIEENNVTKARLSFAALSNCLTISYTGTKMSPVDYLVLRRLKKSLFGPCCWYFEALFSTFGYLMKIYCRLEED